MAQTSERLPVTATDAQAASSTVAFRAASRGFARRTFWSLSHRDYRLIWVGNLFSSSGMWIQQVSVGWLTYQVTGSAFMLGAVNGFRSLPLLLLGPFGGVAADRLDRKKLLFATQMFLMTVTAIFATVVFTGHAAVWNIILFSLLTGVAWAFNMPVRQSIIPSLVPREDLQNAIALGSVGFNITRILGPSVAGLLIAGVGIAGNFYLQSLAYVGVSAMVWQLTVKTSHRRSQDVSVLRNLQDGARYVWSNRLLRTQMSVALIPVLLALPYISLMPIFAEEILDVGATGFGVMMAAPGVGAVLGTMTIASVSEIRRKGLVIFGALIGVGVSLVLFSMSDWFVLSLILLVFTGGFQMVYMSTNQTLIQTTTPDEYRGRVMGIYMLNQGLLPFGSLLAGSVADVWSAPLAILVMGSSVAALSIVGLIVLPAVRRA
jgi:MFS family permease